MRKSLALTATFAIVAASAAALWLKYRTTEAELERRTIRRLSKAGGGRRDGARRT